MQNTWSATIVTARLEVSATPVDRQLSRVIENIPTDRSSRCMRTIDCIQQNERETTDAETRKYSDLVVWSLQGLGKLLVQIRGAYPEGWWIAFSRLDRSKQVGIVVSALVRYLLFQTRSAMLYRSRLNVLS